MSCLSPLTRLNRQTTHHGAYSLSMSRPILPESAYAALGLPSSVIQDLMNPKPVVEARTVEPPDIAAPNLLQSDQDDASPMEPNATSITLYAELLLHIRTVTLFASMRTNHSRETKARAWADGNCITVSHEGESANIRLPFNVAKGGGDAALSLPSQPPTKELTLRLQLEETDDTDVLGALNSEDRQANVVPWSGARLQDIRDAVVVCKNCEGALVDKKRISEWRDLPNENWAEMMDFWHCHKPDEHDLHNHTHEEAIGQKGYAAASRLQALEGIGFVDVMSFLFQKQDCEGAHVSSQDASQIQTIQCRHCDHSLGQPDPLTNGWRLQKWKLGIHSPALHAAGLPSSYSAQKWISARLLSLIENTGMRKFIVHSAPIAASDPQPIDNDEDYPGQCSTPTSSLLLWVFTPDLLFSSSIVSPSRLDPTRAMKVFYKHQTYLPLQPGDPEPANMEDVEFPLDLYKALHSALQTSQRLLPHTARKWGEWEVGLLERFDGAEVLGQAAGDLAGLESEEVD